MLLLYFVVLNVVACLIFIMDKQRAKRKQSRISEFTLHFLEFCGAIFTILPMMYIIRHKNRKFGYYSISYLVFLVWIIALYAYIRAEISLE